MQTHILLEDGTTGIGEVPSGISTGKQEAALLPVAEAINNVNEKIAPQLRGFAAESQYEIDKALIELDGTENKANLGANAILSVSLAAVDAAAKSQNLPLYKYITALCGLPTADYSLPHPMLLMLEGGEHAKSARDFQEYMICPESPGPFVTKLEVGTKIYHALEAILDGRGFETSVGIEGGFWPQKLNTIQAFAILKEAIANSGTEVEKVGMCLDIAANSFLRGKVYQLSGIQQTKNANELLLLYQDLKNQFPSLFSLEDPFAETDLEGWRAAKELAGMILVADDLTVTDPKKLKSLVKENLFAAVIVKPNQVGTLSETLEFAKMAKKGGLKIIVSHRAGETNSSLLSDLAVGIRAEYVKFGAPARGERVAKYNRLLAIERELKTEPNHTHEHR